MAASGVTDSAGALAHSGFSENAFFHQKSVVSSLGKDFSSSRIILAPLKLSCSTWEKLGAPIDANLEIFSISDELVYIKQRTNLL